MSTSATRTPPPPLCRPSLYARGVARDPSCSPAQVRSPQGLAIQCTAAPQWRRATESPAGSMATPPTPVWFQPSPEEGAPSAPQTAPTVTTASKEVSRQKTNITRFMFYVFQALYQSYFYRLPGQFNAQVCVLMALMQQHWHLPEVPQIWRKRTVESIISDYWMAEMYWMWTSLKSGPWTWISFRSCWAFSLMSYQLTERVTPANLVLCFYKVGRSAGDRVGGKKIKISAAEAEISWFFVPIIGQVQKRWILHLQKCNSIISFVRRLFLGKCPRLPNSMTSVYNTDFFVLEMCSFWAWTKIGSCSPWWVNWTSSALSKTARFPDKY